MSNFYEILEVSPTATGADIQRAYRQLIQVWHPDRFQDNPDLQKRAERKTKQLNEAYRHLSDPQLRAKHDEMLNRHQGHATDDSGAPSSASRTHDAEVVNVVACPNPACKVGLRIPTKRRLKVVCPQCHTRFMFDSSLEASWNVHIPEGPNGASDFQEQRRAESDESPWGPWPSASGLLYPIGATIYIATATPAGMAMVTGYGLANLGYLLFAAGVFGGTFRIFGLRNRTQVFGAAVVSFVLGTLLSNVGNY